MKLLPPERLIRTGPQDKASWNYRLVLRVLQRARFRLILRLLGDDHFHRLLEVGYGSGVFLPELSSHCDELFGIDVHSMNADVAAELRGHGIQASLISSSAERMPIEEGFFDCIVSISTLEYVRDLEAGCLEMSRVLKDGGALVAVVPGDSALADLGLRLLTRTDPEEEYGDRRGRVLPALCRVFTCVRRLDYPAWSRKPWCLYRGIRVHKEPVCSGRSGCARSNDRLARRVERVVETPSLSA